MTRQLPLISFRWNRPSLADAEKRPRLQIMLNYVPVDIPPFGDFPALTVLAPNPDPEWLDIPEMT